MVAVRDSSTLLDRLGVLASAVESLDLRTSDYRGLDSSPRRDRLARVIRSYLVPRLEDPTTPLTVVLAGPTGSGKSTLINSLVGRPISMTGVVRPTTTAPRVFCSKTNRRRFAPVGGVECEVTVGASRILSQAALVDTPDIDSTVAGGRALAETLIDTADVVIFVTSALRYADMAPWEILRRAASRGTPIINVMNRATGPSGGAHVDLRARLAAEGLGDEVLRVPEFHIGDGSQAVPSMAVREIARRLVKLSRDRQTHQREIFDRALVSSVNQAEELVRVVARDREWVSNLMANIAGDWAAEAAGFEPLPPSSIVPEMTVARSSQSQKRAVRKMARGFSPAWRASVQASLSAEIGSHLVLMLAGPAEPALELGDVTPRRVLSEFSDTIEREIAAWLWSTETRSPSNSQLESAMIVSMALGESRGELGQVMTGVEGVQVAHRARAELADRTSKLFNQVLDYVLSIVETRLGSPHEAELGKAASEVVPVLRIADA